MSVMKRSTERVIVKSRRKGQYDSRPFRAAGLGILHFRSKCGSICRAGGSRAPGDPGFGRYDR